MSDTIQRITIEGFRSIRRLEDFELRPLNVLIGANGAGKSNFVDFFRLLRALVEKRLQLFIGTAGGADSFLHHGPKVTRQIVGRASLREGGCYEFTLVPTVENRFVFGDERVLSGLWLGFANTADGPKPQAQMISLGSGHDEARLKDQCGADLEFSKFGPGKVRDELSRLQVYHFHDTSTTAGVRRQAAINQNGFLYPDANNLAAFLNRIMYEDRGAYVRIRDVVRLAAPFFDDFQLRPNPLVHNTIQLEWTQKDSDYRFLASHFSDGMLRFICLATALLQPSPPATTVFDEPELGLHPYALTLLGNLFQQATKDTSRQVIVSTQSAQLVNEFEPEDVVVVERTKGESVFRRLDSAKLSGWLEDYTLGELWQKNVFGGGPRNESMPIMPDDDEQATASPKAEGMSTGDGRP